MFFIALIIIYFSIILLLGIIAKRKTKKTPEAYFLAGRSFGPIILLFTLAATNFSAFTFLGFAGNAYKNGLGQFGIMAFGTGFMAIMFFIIGRKVNILGRKNGYITPAELISKQLNSETIRYLFMAIMVIFTIPYLATQAIGAGLLINSFSNINWEVGAIITIVIIMVYVLLGGMKGSGWTDLIQGIIMIFSLSLAVILIAINLGGFEAINSETLKMNADLFTRPGPNNFFTIQIWFSYMILWLFADPMFPQLFSRFYTAKNQKSLKISMVMYPILVSFLFLLPVLIGVWANGVNLQVPSGSEDMVLPLMVKEYAPRIYGLVMIGALAALMSTADSQLLSLSTMLTHDLPFKKKKFNEIQIGKMMILVLTFFAIFFVITGYDPNVGIMGTLVSTSFSGLAVLCPTTIAALYWKKTNKYGCISSIITGEISVFLFQYKVIPSFGFLPAVWAILVAIIVLIIVSLITQNKNRRNIPK